MWNSFQILFRTENWFFFPPRPVLGYACRSFSKSFENIIQTILSSGKFRFVLRLQPNLPTSAWSVIVGSGGGGEVGPLTGRGGGSGYTSLGKTSRNLRHRAFWFRLLPSDRIFFLFRGGLKMLFQALALKRGVGGKEGCVCDCVVCVCVWCVIIRPKRLTIEK